MSAHDAHLTSYLDLIDHYNQERHQLQVHLKNAFLNLAKAKVALGPARVGPDSYDLVSQPAYKYVRLDGVENFADSELHEDRDLAKHGPFSLFTRCSGDNTRSIDRDELDSTMTAIKNESSLLNGQYSSLTLRHRKAMIATSSSSSQAKSSSTEEPSRQVSEPDASASGATTRSEKSPAMALSDPIIQFTALPPPSLRTAQCDFSKSLENVICLVNVERKLRQLEQVINEARKQ